MRYTKSNMLKYIPQKIKRAIIISLSGILISAMGFSFVEAGNSDDNVSVFVLNTGSNTFYPNQRDQVVLRIEIDHAPNAMSAFTVQNIASRPAENITDIERLYLWLDNGDGFFISDTETKLSEAVWDNQDAWVFSGIEHFFDQKITLWVTADISYTAVNNRRIKMQIPGVLDFNNNLQYDSGDKGIFLSDRAGPSGAEMNFSSQIISTAGGVCAHDAYPPSAPTDFQAESFENQGEVQVSWTNPTELDFSHINLYRSTIFGTRGDLIYNTDSGLSYLDQGLSNNVVYYYTIEAKDRCNNSSEDFILDIILPEPSEQAVESDPEPDLGTESALDSESETKNEAEQEPEPVIEPDIESEDTEPVGKGEPLHYAFG